MNGEEKRNVAIDKDNQSNRILVPVVFVPGFLGTKLLIGSFIYDPDDKWLLVRQWVQKPRTAKSKMLGRKKGSVIHREEQGGEFKIILTEKKEQRGIIREDQGQHSVFKGAYFSLYTALEQLGDSFPVYTAGYDWRKSNHESAATFTEHVEALTKPKKQNWKTTPQVIVVTHSMGGVVVRSALKQRPALKEKILGVVHVCQPVAGAPFIYRLLFSGARHEYGDTYYAELALGNNGQEIAELAIVLPSALEMLPNKYYQDKDKKPWCYVRWEKGQKEEELLRDPLYSDLDKFGGDDLAYNEVHDQYNLDRLPGVYNAKVHKEEIKSQLINMATDAMEFQADLGKTMHPNTYSFYGKQTARGPGASTDTGIRFYGTKEGGAVQLHGIQPIKREWGDTTVPISSAAALFENELDILPTEENLEKYRQFCFPGVKHMECFESSELQEALKTLIEKIARKQ